MYADHEEIKKIHNSSSGALVSYSIFLKQVCQHLLNGGRLVLVNFDVFQWALYQKGVSDKNFKHFNSVLGSQNSTPSLIRPNFLTFWAIVERPFQSIICA